MGRRRNRWIRRWVIATAVWAVPIALVAIHEIQVETEYNRADLDRVLTAWRLSAADIASGAANRCTGTPEDAREAGCPASVVAANEPALRAALDDYAKRGHTLVSYLSQAIFGYWVVPSAIVFAIGLIVALVRRALRRPPLERPAAAPLPSRSAVAPVEPAAKTSAR
jgi:hypothetical protein